MKKILLAPVFGATLLLISSVPKQVAQVKAENVTIKMGYFEYGSMCRGAEEGAEKSGYVYDFMQKLATYTGWQYEYTYGSFSELYDELALNEDGGIQILPYTNWNEVRNTEVLFSKNSLLEEIYYIATRPNDTRFVTGDFSKLEGMKIASVVGADQNIVLNDFLTSKSISATINESYADPESSWDALESGEVDAAIFSNISYRTGANWNVIGSFGEKPTYIAVAKGREDLLKQLDDAFDTLLQTNSVFVSELKEKLFAGSPALFCLSESEKAWLNEHPTIRIGYIEGTNLVYAKKEDDGSYTGFVPEYIDQICKTLKINNKVQYFGYKSPSEAGEDLLADRIEAAFPFFPSFLKSEEKKLIITNDVNNNSVAVVYKNSTGYANSMNKVAVLSTSILQYYLQENYRESEIVVVNTVDEAIKLLKKGDVTGFVSETSETSGIIQTHTDFSEYILNKGCGTAFAVRLSNSPFIVTLNRGISSISDSEVSALIENHITPYVTTFADYIQSHPEALTLVIVSPIFVVFLIVVVMIVLRLRKKAQIASEAKTKFLFNMSHDIRTPMNAIIGYTDSAIRHKDDQQKVDENLNKIKLSSNHLLKLINDILEMSRIESGNLELAENPLDVREEAEKVDHMIQTLAVSKSINFKTTIHKISNPYVYADELHVNQVLINLISNAIKYTKEGGKVEYIVTQISNVIDGKVTFRFEINDNGIGMSDEFQKHLFESFSREKSSTVSKQEGTGLGLSIVKKIVDLAEGRVYFKSRLNEGTQFTVELPFKVMKEDAVKRFQEDKKTAKKANEKGNALKGKRVLVVEDNEMNRDIANDLLTDVGCIVETAEDGLVAVNLIKEKGDTYYDVVLMDIQMPVMDGYEATKQIRKLFPESKLTILAVSANAFKEDVDASLSAGMNAHISKPINPKELIEELSKIK